MLRPHLPFAAACLVLASAPAAQEPASPPVQDTRVVDFVAAMVGTKAILASQVTELWRDELRDDAERPPALRQYVSPAMRHALWGHLLEVLIARETTAQSARLMGRSPDEVEEQVQRLVQEELVRQAETSGGLNAFARQLGVIGSSIGTRAEDLRAQILREMAYYQGVLRELHDQRAMLATPKEMRALFDADPSRFASPGSVKIAFSRYARDRDPQAAARAAARTVQAWRALPAPVTEAAVRGTTLPSEPGVESILAVLDVALGQEGTPALKAFAPLCKPGDVSDPVQDEGWVSVMLCLERTEGAEAVFGDAAVQEKLRKEIADRRWSQIAARLFPEDRVGVKRLPWGEPDAMERRRR